ncbi:hypothetical protein DFH09DRAFT_1492118, partial [Mycena vulgaris]
FHLDHLKDSSPGDLRIRDVSKFPLWDFSPLRIQCLCSIFTVSRSLWQPPPCSATVLRNLSGLSMHNAPPDERAGGPDAALLFARTSGCHVSVAFRTCASRRPRPTRRRPRSTRRSARPTPCPSSTSSSSPPICARRHDHTAAARRSAIGARRM